MRAKHGGGDPLDRRMTPRWVVEQIFDEVLPTMLLPDAPRILDAGAGSGIFLEVARERLPRAELVGIDIDPAAGPWETADEAYEGDFLESDLGQFDFVLGNPPFPKAQEFCEAALECSKYVGFLLRLEFLANASRVAFWEAHPPGKIWVFPFTFPGDSANYAFFVWHPMRLAPMIHWLPVLDAESRR